MILFISYFVTVLQMYASFYFLQRCYKKYFFREIPLIEVVDIKNILILKQNLLRS